MSAMVYLVGAGPGDPGLITVKGNDCIRRADVIVYDYLAAPRLLEAARPDAEIIYVGKKGGEHTLPQEQINALLVEKARAGKVVTRLKGGDPFIFGRGGEEAEALIERGIAFEIVPGVTSAIAAPAYAGIPLTHRKFTATVAFVTGHEDPAKPGSRIDWAALARGIGTRVFLMGVKNLPFIVERLVENGCPEKTPVALVRWGTTPRQETVSGTLATIVERVRAAGLKAPAIIVVGDVVGLRESMQWFEKRPLFGRRIVVTRAREQASDLLEKLSALGAECIQSPTIRVDPLTDVTALDAAIDQLAAYDWLIFTSVNGVEHFFDRLFARGKDVRALPPGIRTAVIGPATAQRLRAYGITSDIVPENYRAESVVAAFSREAVAGRRVLLPRAAEAREVLPAELSRMGARVDEIAVYQTRLDETSADHLRERLAAGEVDMVTFTSSSTAKNFASLLPAEAIETWMKGVAVASIGPITTRTAEALGFTVHATADRYTIDGLCEAICDFYRRSGADSR